MDEENKANCNMHLIKMFSYKKESSQREESEVQQRHQSSSLDINSSANFMEYKTKKMSTTTEEKNKHEDNVLKFVHLHTK